MARWLLHFLPKPNGRLVLDRIDNDGHYAPGNLRWATIKESTRNSRNNRRIVIGGESKLLCEWAEQTGLQSMTIHSRIQLGLPERFWLFKGKITKTMLLQDAYGS